MNNEPTQQEVPPQGNPILPYPLDANTLFALKKGGLMLFGSATFVLGTVTVTDRRIKPSSTVLACYKSLSGTIGVAILAVCADSTITITSYDAASAVKTADVSTVSYFVIL